VYNELIVTSKEFMSTVTAVDPHWLAESGSVFYSIKEKGYGRQNKKTTEIEITKQMQLEAQIHKDRERQLLEEAEAKRKERMKTSANSPFARIATPGAKRSPFGGGGGATPRRRGGMGF
jgi:pre-mRNA-splicing factor ATP-dependent RNA helicase DHX38/PRP16